MAKVKNFTVNIQPGHDTSAQLCAYCDYIASPFLIRRKLFIDGMTDGSFEGQTAYINFFLQYPLQGQVSSMLNVACVDVVFHVIGHASSRGLGIAELDKSAWQPFAKKWTVDRIIVPGSNTHTWKCDEVAISCRKYKQSGLTSPGCCLRDLSQCLKAVLHVAAMHNVTAESGGGTNLGMVKLYGGLIPWERDADVDWDALKMDVIEGPIREAMSKYPHCNMGTIQYTTIHRADMQKCLTLFSTHCTYHRIDSQYWYVEMFGSQKLNDPDLYGFSKPTMVYLDGSWVRGRFNPGQFSRNYLGDNLLGHVEHYWGYHVSNGYAPYANAEYKPFLPCPSDVVKHACLAGNFLPQGNIQFQYAHV